MQAARGGPRQHEDEGEEASSDEEEELDEDEEEYEEEDEDDIQQSVQPASVKLVEKIPQ